jgi:hypothetical protein
VCQGPPLPDPARPDPTRTAGLCVELSEHGIWIVQYTTDPYWPEREAPLTARALWRYLDAPRWLQDELVALLEDDPGRRGWRPRRRRQ